MIKKPENPKKPKKPKKEVSRDDQIWKRMNQQILGMLIFTVLPFLIIAMDFGIKYPKTGTMAQLMTVANDWQGLTAGTFALLAAAFTARAVVMQISSAESLEQTRLEEARALDERSTTRALKAARSVMPLTLSVLSDYTTAIAKAAIAVLDRSPEARVELTAGEMPDLPTTPQSVIADLQAFILAAPDEIGSNIADILSDLQLLAANAASTWERTTSENRGEIVMKSNFEALVGRAAVLHARLSALFPYARRETETSPSAPVEEEVAKALQLWMVFSEIYPGCHRAAAHYLKEATSPAP